MDMVVEESEESPLESAGALPSASAEKPPDVRISKVLGDLERARLLLRELDLAAATLELARIARGVENLRQNYIQARSHFETANALLPLLTPTAQQDPEIQRRLRQLKEWLDALAHRIEPT